MSGLVKTLRTASVSLLALLVALALVGTSCSAVNPPVLTVNGWTLSQRDFQTQIDSLVSALEATQPGSTTGLKGPNGDGYTTTFTSQFLNQRMLLQLAVDEVQKRGLQVTDADKQQAQSIIEQSFGGSSSSTSGSSASSAAGAAVVKSLDSAYRNDLLTGVAAELALQRDIVAKSATDAGLKQLFDANASQYADEACVSHILILAGTGSNPTDADYAAALTKIQQVQSQLNGTSNFADLAKQYSQDPGSAGNGGDLGCAPKGTYVAPFDQAVWSLPIGVVSQPVKTQYGYHLILVRKRGQLSFDDVKDQLRQQVSQNAAQVTQQALLEKAMGAKITVDGRYGSFDTKTGQITTPPGAKAQPAPTTPALNPLGAGSTTSTTAAATAG